MDKYLSQGKDTLQYTMTGTAHAVFKVVEDAGEYFWLKEVEGPGKGLQVAVPKRRTEYGAKLRERIEELEPGKIIEASLRSTNERNTAWRFEQFTELDTGPSNRPADREDAERAPADD